MIVILKRNLFSYTALLFITYSVYQFIYLTSSAWIDIDMSDVPGLCSKVVVSIPALSLALTFSICTSVRCYLKQ